VRGRRRRRRRRRRKVVRRRGGALFVRILRPRTTDVGCTI